MLNCPKCGYNNELGRIFCHSCGTKLDLTQIKPPTEAAKMRRRVKAGATRALRIAIESSIAAILVLVIVLMCLTPHVEPVKATNAELLAFETKRAEFDKMLAKRKGGQIVITESDLNVFLNSFTFEKPTGSGIEVTPKALRAKLKEGGVKIEFLGAMHFNGMFNKDLYIAYECKPVIEGEQCVFQPLGGWIGKMPLHPRLLVATSFVDNYFGHLFKDLSEDKKLIDQVTRIKVTKETVTFEKDPPH